jgi:isopenicillin N synthase-like dioxygenase
MRSKARVVEEVQHACTALGSFYVVNHGIPESVVSGAFRESERFFELPLEEKMRVHASKCPPHRGYVRTHERRRGSAALVGARGGDGDFKETLDLGPDLPADDPAIRPGNPLYGPNVWPDWLPGFRATIQDYYNANTALARRLLRLIAASLGLDEAYFDDKVDRPMARMKLLHYPPQEPTPGVNLEGVGAHTDYSCLTVVAQDQVGGLELCTKAGAWMPVRPVAGALFVNVGDQLARWTNDRLVATVHRVATWAERDRYSIAFFFHPNSDTVIRCFETCISPDDPAKYPPITAGRDLLDRLEGAYDRR